VDIENLRKLLDFWSIFW